MKFLEMHINNIKIGFDVFTVYTAAFKQFNVLLLCWIKQYIL